MAKDIFVSEFLYHFAMYPILLKLSCQGQGQSIITQNQVDINAISILFLFLSDNLGNLLKAKQFNLIVLINHRQNFCE